MANRIAQNVEATAASWGLFPKGTAMKNDQLARERPSSRWMTNTRPPLVPAKIRKCQMIETMIQAGRYARVMLMCHDLDAYLN